MKFSSKFLFDEAAATSLEYALVVMLIAMALLVGFGILGGSVEQAFDYVNSGVIDVVPASE